VVESVCADPGAAPVGLLRDLFVESAKWTREAWGSPPGFSKLGAELLRRGGEDTLADFVWALGRSFDTWGACHEIWLDVILATRLAEVCGKRADGASGEEDRRLWNGGKELLTKLSKGTAAQGWVVLKPGTAVSNVRVVPGWRHKLAVVSRKLGQLFSSSPH
jgi:hypothetical protein